MTSFSLPSCVVLYPLPFHVILCFSYSVLLLIDAISVLKARMGLAFFLVFSSSWSVLDPGVHG